MNDLAGAVTILSAMRDAVEGPMRSLRAQLPAALEPTRPTIQLFSIVENAVGVAVQLTCTRGDGRLISWLIEVWIYPTGPNDWSANVKAEIDLDDRNGDDRCVLNDQQVVSDSVGAGGAIKRAAELITKHPREDLLESGWEPPEWAGDERPP